MESAFIHHLLLIKSIMSAGVHPSRQWERGGNAAGRAAEYRHPNNYMIKLRKNWIWKLVLSKEVHMSL